MKDDNKGPDSWTALAAVIGFVSGAGLMSHADLMSILKSEFFASMQISNNQVVVHGRDLICMLSGASSYLFLLAGIGVFAYVEAIRSRKPYVRIAGIGIVLLMVSFLSLAIYSINQGYHPLQRQLDALLLGGPVHMTWIWK